MEREFNYEIMQEVQKRWSPRAFAHETIAREELMAILEAARYAPSCFNEQPWRFVIADDNLSLRKMRSVLTSSNQEWASRALALILIVSKKNFTQNDKPNDWHLFDAGTAWGYLSLEAQRRGLITHAMGGFNKEEARKEFHISEDYSIITVVAVGKYGQKSDLSEALQKREYPETRKEIADLLL